MCILYALECMYICIFASLQSTLFSLQNKEVHCHLKIGKCYIPDFFFKGFVGAEIFYSYVSGYGDLKIIYSGPNSCFP